MADYNINAITRRQVFSGSAGTGPYSFTFQVLDQNDLAVYKNATKLSLTTNYTVTVNANGTGDVTLGVAATGSDTITIIGARDIERTTDFVTAGDLRASALNEQLDGQIIMTQQIAEESKRQLTAPVNDPEHVDDGGTLDMTLPAKADRINKLLSFDTNGNPIVGEDIGDYKGNWAASTSYVVRDLVKDTSTNNIFRANTAHTSSGSQPLTTNTDSAKWDLIVDAATATTSATAAATSATAAATSATAAATSATASAGSSTTATTKASEAASSATAAAASAAAAAASADNFDDTYLGAKSSDPTQDNDGDALTAGDLYFNTTSNQLKYYTGSAWVAIVPGIANVSEDTTPQLGGNLDVNGNSIVSVSNGNISITPNGSGKVILDGLSHPTADGSAGQFLKTDGGGNLSFDTVTTDLSGDSSPQLGGNLDVVTHSIVSTSNRDITINPNGTGNVLIGNYEFDADQSVGAGQDNYVLTYDNSTGHVSLEAAAAAGATGGGSDEIFYENGQNVTTNYTITNGKNAMSAGPITIDSGVTVTVGTGETWTVV